MTTRGGRGRLLPAVALSLAIVTILAVAFLAWFLNRDTLPSRPAAFQRPSAAAQYSVYIVKQAEAGSLVLSGPVGSAGLRVPRPAVAEVMTPGSLAQVQLGDWVNVVGVLDDVRNFSIRAVIVIAGQAAAGPDGAGRSAAGFSGIEVRADPGERIVSSGRVTALDGQKLSLTGAAGDMTLTLLPRASVFRMAKADSSAIEAGDRLASLVPLREGQQPAAVLAGRIAAAPGR